jgi:hypothetical protein
MQLRVYEEAMLRQPTFLGGAEVDLVSLMANQSPGGGSLKALARSHPLIKKF